MRAEEHERRRNPRVFFLKDDAMTVRLEKIGQQEAPFQVLVKDLSLAGIGFLLKRTEPVIVNSGDRLVITEIKGANAVDFLTHSALVVEWVVDTEILDHIGFGCSFNNLDKTTQSKLDRYVLDWR